MSPKDVLSEFINLDEPWIVVLCPLSTKAKATGGRVPMAVEFDDWRYQALSLNRQGQLGSAYLDDVKLDGIPRQHMSPGASIQGMGIGALLAYISRERGDDNYGLRALRAMAEAPSYKTPEAREMLEDTQIELSRYGLAPHPYQMELEFPRKSNPSRALDRVLSKQSQALSRLTEAGDGEG